MRACLPDVKIISITATRPQVSGYNLAMLQLPHSLCQAVSSWELETEQIRSFVKILKTF